MKKKTVGLLLIVVAAMTVLTACGGEENVPLELTPVAAVEATCTTAGNAAYWTDGEKYYADESGATEVTLDSLTVAALGHAYEAPVWSWGDDFTASASFACSRGDDTQTMTAEVTHTTTTTCQQIGNIKYSATVELGGITYVADKSIADTALAEHTYGEPVWLWTKDGSAAAAQFTCSVCKDVHAEEATVTKNAEKSTAATCTAAGADVFDASVTFNSGQYSSEKSVTLPGAHVYAVTGWTWADDNSAATLAYKCTTCKKEYTLSDSEIEVTEVAATCTNDGSKTYTASVTLGGNTITDNKTEVIPSAGVSHTYGEPVWEWAEDGSAAAAQFTCSVCGDVHAEEATVTKNAKKSTAATCTAAGADVFDASVTFNARQYSSEKSVAAATVPHSYKSEYVPAETGNGKFYQQCENCSDRSEKGVFGDRAVTVNGTTYSSPYACYTTENAGKGVTYDAVNELFVVEISNQTVTLYTGSGLTVNGINNEVAISVAGEVTIPSVTFENGFRELFIIGEGTLTVSGAFSSQAKTTTLRTNLTVNGAFETNTQRLVIESGVTTLNGAVTARNITVGTKDNSTAPELKINVNGNREGLKSDGFNALNVQLLSGTTTVRNETTDNCGFSFNHADDAVKVGENATLNIVNFEIAVAAWGSAANNVDFIVDGTLSITGSITEYRDVTPTTSVTPEA